MVIGEAHTYCIRISRIAICGTKLPDYVKVFLIHWQTQIKLRAADCGHAVAQAQISIRRFDGIFEEFPWAIMWAPNEIR